MDFTNFIFFLLSGFTVSLCYAMGNADVLTRSKPFKAYRKYWVYSRFYSNFLPFENGQLLIHRNVKWCQNVSLTLILTGTHSL